MNASHRRSLDQISLVAVLVLAVLLAACGKDGDARTVSAERGDAAGPPVTTAPEPDPFEVNRQRILDDIAASGDSTLTLTMRNGLFVVDRPGRTSVMPVTGAGSAVGGYVVADDAEEPDPVISYLNCARAAGPDAPQCADAKARSEEPNSRVWLVDGAVRGLPIFPVDGDPSNPTGYMTVIGAISLETSRDPAALASIAECAREVREQASHDRIDAACVAAGAYHM